MDSEGGFSHEIGGMPELPTHLDDGQKAMLLGSHLLAACLTYDSEAGVYAAEDGDLIAMLPVDDDKLAFAKAAFIREGNKAITNAETELVIAWFEDGNGHTFIRWELNNPRDLPGNEMFEEKSMDEGGYVDPN